ncbi:hypothetical protein BT63DRAFT_409650 [Microthyrium microscopicum]|uniref:Uncharacterized protein n=1 Tax=Microthyrium microscopicum TaxID=703497 RepID=A0A6A6UUY4_9PEZI|nr:hypothetical protein BT63DRAFT_409650 [Microthyrium microscopicum]
MANRGPGQAHETAYTGAVGQNQVVINWCGAYSEEVAEREKDLVDLQLAIEQSQAVQRARGTGLAAHEAYARLLASETNFAKYKEHFLIEVEAYAKAYKDIYETIPAYDQYLQSVLTKMLPFELFLVADVKASQDEIRELRARVIDQDAKLEKLPEQMPTFLENNVLRNENNTQQEKIKELQKEIETFKAAKHTASGPATSTQDLLSALDPLAQSWAAAIGLLNSQITALQNKVNRQKQKFANMENGWKVAWLKEHDAYEVFHAKFQELRAAQTVLVTTIGDLQEVIMVKDMLISEMRQRPRQLV